MASKKLKSPLLPDKYYHIYNGGNNKEQLFHHSGDYYFFLAKYKHYVAPFVDTYAFCLIPNHFHFLIKTRVEENGGRSVVPNQLRKLFICYSMRINHFHRRSGGLFTKNYQRIEIDNMEYLTNVIYYIHRNPSKHKIQPDFQKYQFSSYKIITSTAETLLNREDVIDFFGSLEEFTKYHHVELPEIQNDNRYCIEEEDDLG